MSILPVVAESPSLPGLAADLRASALGTYRRYSSGSETQTEALKELTQKERSDTYTPSELRTIQRWQMLDGARALLPDERGLLGCGRWLTPAGEQAGVTLWGSSKGGRFGNVQRCGSVWLCPLCASKISQHRLSELRAAVAGWRAAGGVVAMMTYTFSHHLGDALPALLGAPAKGTFKDGDYKPASGLLGARSVAMSGRAYNDLKRDCGLAGSVRALEITHGAVNGFNPHIHDMLFLEAGTTPAQLDQLETGLKQLWQRGLAAVGLTGSEERAAVWVDASEDWSVEEYITKMADAGLERTERTKQHWDLPSEVTQQQAKLGKHKGRTPMQLLSDATFGAGLDAAVAGALFVEYARAMKGRRQLVWSNGLRARCGLGDELQDLELAECSENKDLFEMDTLAPARWRLIVADKQQPFLKLQLRGDGGEQHRARLAAFLAHYPDVRGLRRVRHVPPNGSLRLADPFADERDVLKPVGFVQARPWDELQATLAAADAGVWEQLYKRHASGEEVHWPAERAAARAKVAEELVLRGAVASAEVSPASASAPASFFEGVEALGVGAPASGGAVSAVLGLSQNAETRRGEGGVTEWQE